MRVVVVVLSMMIGAAGCARKAPETPQPTPATTDASPPAATAPAKPAAASPSTVTNKPEEDAAKPPQATTAAPASPEKPATPATPSASAPPGQPAAPATPAKPAPSTATAKPAPTKPAPAPTPKPATPPPQTAAKPTAPAPRAASPNPTLDLTALKEQLKSTKAIGLMTKLTLKNQVDDLLDGFRDLYAGKGKNTMPQLRQSYDMLMMKVLSLLQDKDQKLASDIVASREVIWGLLADPKKFAALDV